jgi:hypothetical protein
MKELPILFSTPMVQAILDGRKTQTRRVVKPGKSQSEWLTAELLSRAIVDFVIDPGVQLNHPEGGPLTFIRCPYGQIGDILWVRETWHYSKHDTVPYLRLSYKATPDDGDNSEPWKPSIFMPKSLSRIRLEITDKWVERLQDIDENDALDEGINSFTKDGVGFKFGIDGWNWSYQNGHPFMCSNATLAYRELWESINGKDSWEKNPWVWGIQFKNK